MKAVGFETYGSPEVLKMIEVETPQAGPGEVRVRVKSAGVQPADCAVRRGWTLPGMTVSLPHVTGNEFAGVVDQVGEGVADWAAGDEVLGFRMQQAYAEYVVAPADQIVAKPPVMSWEVAGSLSASGQTAHTAIETLRIGPGDTLFINGAAGGVGTMAVQLARLRGATVIGAASPGNHDYLRSLGAIPVAYGEGLEERLRALAPGGIEAALDAAGEDGLRVSARLVPELDRVVTIVAFEAAQSLGASGLRSRRSAQRLAELARLYAEGKLLAHIRSSYPLSRAADAHREVETGHGRGKVVLIVDG
ncbi:NADP-dependent oxidoreductase [Cohnella sp. REN36]|uniref:NADP-dependent oxidoreductase n=1 Tax=Cohnella sp. REN36 TaxID=2887347 RepID=UPI001D134377|nr:NADP-dependent oxidoreductase [Cohnella sp. REN36]MCC3371614.1 NADP-dependent oxidoreductase [Cohnella sp. REN36]